MFKKKQGQQLEPLKINKSQANYQFLLLEMMSKLVKEQQQSNKLLKKLVGDDQRQSQKSSISYLGPKREQLGTPKRDKSLKDYHSDTFSHENLTDPSKQIEERENLSVVVDRISENKNQKGKENDKLNDELVKKVDVMTDILSRMECHLSKSVKLAEQASHIKKPSVLQQPQQTIQKELLKMKIKGRTFQKSKEKQKGEEVKQKQFDIFEKQSTSKQKIQIKKLDDLNKSQKNTEKYKPRKVNDIIVDKLISHSQLQIQEAPVKAELDRDIDLKKNYAIVSEILPYSDRREIKAKISVEDIYNFYKNKGYQQEKFKVTEEWLGLVFRATASICWNMLSNHLLSFDETKILFTENIIYNFIEFMKNTKELGYGTYRVELVQNINLTSVNILSFLCTQYPQTKVQDPNIAIRSQIPSIDNKGHVKYNMIGKVCRNKVTSFKKKKSGEYTQQIMKTINFMIDRSVQEFDGFNDLMTDLFEEIFIPYKKRKIIAKQNQEENNEDQAYYEKVKSYTKFLIGRKINKNTPKYTNAQIENGIFFVKSPSILRIITKWVQELDQIVRHPEREIKNANKEFKDHQGMPMHLYGQIKNGIYKAIKQHQDKLTERVRCIKRQCYHMEVMLTLQNFITDPDQIHLSQEQISVGKYCTYLKSAIASYIGSQLNELIDFLLETPSNVDETKIGITQTWFQQQCRKDLDALNLVNFKLFDLLRCKCISKESEIIYLLKRLNEKSNDPDDPFQIVRVKDRLGTGTRDILINGQISRGVVCEIQLAVASNMEKKQELLDQYNHFLYELKRAKLGSITQSASIWSTLEQRAKFFQQDPNKTILFNKRKSHSCVVDSKRFSDNRVTKFIRPIICVSCENFFDIPRTCLPNIKCQSCHETYCGECHYQQLKEEDRKEFLFQKNFFKCLFSCITLFNDYSKPLPKFGFLIRRNYLKKQLLFYRVIAKKSSNLQKQEEMSLELVISGIDSGELFNKTINKKSIEANMINGQYYLTENSKEVFSNFFIYEITKQGKGIEKVTLTYKNLLENFYETKIKYVNIMKHPVYVDDIKLLKKPKIIYREIESYKNILSEDTLVTYLKIYSTIFILQIQVDENLLQKQLVKIININRLKSFANDKCNSVSMQFREVTDELNLIKLKFQPQLFQGFSRRLTKLYLNFGMIKDLSFLELFPNIKVFFISNNQLTSLQGIEKLQQLAIICFDNNKIKSMKPLNTLVNISQLSGTDNFIVSLDGIEKLERLKKLSLSKNKIEKMDHLNKLTNIKELLLSNNPISKIENISHFENLEEINLGKSSVVELEPLSVFKKIKKVSLNGINLKQIGPIFRKFQILVRLNLSENLIQKMEHFEEFNQLVELNLRQNKIRAIQGLQNCGKLQILKISNNFITDVRGIKSLDSLKVLKIFDNPLNDCSQIHTMSRKHFKLYYTQPDKAIDKEHQPTPQFYDRYKIYTENRYSSGSESNGSSDDD